MVVNIDVGGVVINVLVDVVGVIVWVVDLVVDVDLLFECIGVYKVCCGSGNIVIEDVLINDEIVVVIIVG